MKRFLAIIMSLAVLFSVNLPVGAAAETLSDDIVILYTNDVHTYIDGDLSYDVISAIKKDLQKKYKYVLLADAGDHIQGTAYGSMDKGESMIKMMNEAEYDVATLGNHEFDYDMAGCLNAIKLADFPYVSSNFYHEKNGKRTENVLDSFVTFDCGDEKVAFIGITTPETFEKSTPSYFQDENGNFIYGISGGKDGAALQKDVQNAIDEAKKDGATQIIALGHLGIDSSSEPWTSTETISNVSGLDAFIDGHSHSTVECEAVKDKSGEDVILTQTGSYFDRIGMMVIDAETDDITTDFIECEDVLANDGKTVIGQKLISDLYEGTEVISDSAVKEIKDKWIGEIDNKLGEKIGSAKVTLDNYDEDGNRLVRSQETNTGDFAADALYYLFDDMEMDVDVAIMNGGGIRNTAITGDISYKTCKDIHTFGNVACLQKVTGQQILDALEWGARKVGTGENGGFLQVAGMTYKIDTSIPDTVKEDEIGTWTGAPDKYRVYDVKVYNKETNSYELLDVNAEYNLAGHNYTLRDLGDGYAMFDGAVNVLDYVAEDYMVLANYAEGFENGIVDAQNSPLKEKYSGMLLDYGTVNGSGRIEISENSGNNEFDEIYVGGVKVTKENKDDVLGDGGSVKYDAATDTLTLKDAEISNKNGHGIYAYGINLTVNGIDTDADDANNISAKGGCGIYVEGDGYGENGNLVISGAIGNISAEDGSAVCTYEDITFKGNIGNISGSGDLNCGIISWFGNVVVEKSAVLGNIYSKDYDGIDAGKDIVISGKTANITGGGYTGIHATGGDIYITGVTQDITGYASGMEAYMSEEGVGNISISGKVGKIYGECMGIYAEGYLNISGIAEAYATDVNDEDVFAVSAGAGIILPEEFDIVAEPERYLIKSYENENSGSYYTIADKDGIAAKKVKFSGFANQFVDVNEYDWYYNNVAYVTVKGLMNGVSDVRFAPKGTLTRGMLVTVLYRAEGEPLVNSSASFADVNAGMYYADAVSWAQSNGIVNGVSANEFAPDKNITREQIAAIMYRYAEYKGYDIGEGGMKIREFDDYESISAYAVNAMTWAVNTELINGKTETTINPKDNATRAETAAILQRFIEGNK